ncbi:hypothetical protein L2E82_45698 [Cichorium intybus]|uniref:Uncharacterized protein n=1 Tax=Cichorium intybus TaxID=13427 RepID=A0ACB8ZUL1_CICIN|nr:hypothetical protein L2E82_45698 [Cichorium intybus]
MTILCNVLHVCININIVGKKLNYRRLIWNRVWIRVRFYILNPFLQLGRVPSSLLTSTSATPLPFFTIASVLSYISTTRIPRSSPFPPPSPTTAFPSTGFALYCDNPIWNSVIGEYEFDVGRLSFSSFDSLEEHKSHDIVIKFNDLQAELKVPSSSVPYEKLIKNCCVSLEIADSLVCSAWYTSCEYNLVHHIKKMINDQYIKPFAETFKSMISLCVKLEDFDGAYSMIRDLD